MSKYSDREVREIIVEELNLKFTMRLPRCKNPRYRIGENVVIDIYPEFALLNRGEKGVASIRYKEHQSINRILAYADKELGLPEHASPAKFKVGDKVRILSDATQPNGASNGEDVVDIFGVKSAVGTEGVIKRINEGFLFPYAVYGLPEECLHGMSYWSYTSDQIELVKDKSITSNEFVTQQLNASHEDEGHRAINDFCNYVEQSIIEKTKTDAINPDHYKLGLPCEAIEYQLAVGKRYDSKHSPLVFNVLKYVARAPLKNGIEDLKKAQWYLNKLIEVYNEG